MDVLSAHVEHLGKGKVLCIGDLILDHFIYGQVSRISPEAPVPILQIARETSMLGGAGNVVRNILSLGGSAAFISVIGHDAAGKNLTALVGEEKNIEAYLQPEKGRLSTIKTRYIAGNQQLLRADKEVTEAISADTEKKITSLIRTLVPDTSVVVLSDYAKGVLTDTIIKESITAARKAKIKTIIDPKRRDLSIYSGASILTPNVNELALATGLPVETDEDVVKAAKAVIKRFDFEAVLVTRNQKGMTLVTATGKHFHYPAAAQEVYDVSGAGDTVIATLAICLSSGLSLDESVFLSNIAAGIVVGRVGTAAVYRTELKTALLTHNLVAGTRKILPQKSALAYLARLRDSGKKIGFTNGCFDLIHPGHVSLMEQAKAACDVLVVGLNSDDSVKRLKGKDRPVQNEMSRALVLASLEAVDVVMLFREDTPIELIKAIKPDVLIKGADYTVDTVVGGDFVQKYGGKVLLAKLSKGESTTNIVKKLAK
ncbi:MAG: D-glycero-beta-D-manno-heptose-7-phosphate kinase [Proteobacteria bacterium]|nr:D-glycero-beta-D-manno-heptose-7-phosphate kinase [Pseudomonadota bacterium]